MKKGVYYGLILFILCLLVAGLKVLRFKPEITKETEYEKINTISKSFDCFEEIDTSKRLISVGCGNAFYALVDSQHVLKIQFPNSKNYIGCSKFLVDTIYEQEMYLLKYDRGRAHLGNICSCIRFNDAPKPIKKLKIKEGKLIIAGSQNPNKADSNLSLKTIWIESAVFSDSLGIKEKITDKLLFKIEDLGIVG